MGAKAVPDAMQGGRGLGEELLEETGCGFSETAGVVN